MNRRLKVTSLIGKFSTARCVCAPQYASAGTCISPRLSCSVRYSSVIRPGGGPPGRKTHRYESGHHSAQPCNCRDSRSLATTTLQLESGDRGTQNP